MSFMKKELLLFWDKISQTFANIFYCIGKVLKTLIKFLDALWKSSQTIINFHNAFGEKLSNFHQISLMVWGKAPKLSWNCFVVLGKDLKFLSNFLDTLEKGLQLTLKFLMDWKRSQANLKVENFLVCMQLQTCQKSFHVKWRKFPSKHFGCLMVPVTKGRQPRKMKGTKTK